MITVAWRLTSGLHQATPLALAREPFSDARPGYGVYINGISNPNIKRLR